jgi:hypothetical protein
MLANKSAALETVTTCHATVPCGSVVFVQPDLCPDVIAHVLFLHFETIMRLVARLCTGAGRLTSMLRLKHTVRKCRNARNDPVNILTTLLVMLVATTNHQVPKLGQVNLLCTAADSCKQFGVGRRSGMLGMTTAYSHCESTARSLCADRWLTRSLCRHTQPVAMQLPILGTAKSATSPNPVAQDALCRHPATPPTFAMTAQPACPPRPPAPPPPV